MDEIHNQNYDTFKKSNKEKSTSKNNMTIIISFIAIIISFYALFRIYEVNKEFTYFKDEQFSNKLKIDSLKNQLSDFQLKFLIEKLKNTKGLVDLTSSSIQEIGDGFMVVDLDLKQHLTGIKVFERIINYTALNHQNVNFSIKIGEQEKSFFINRISSGNSTRFSVYIPDVPVEKTNWATIKYHKSTVSYYTR